MIAKYKSTTILKAVVKMKLQKMLSLFFVIVLLLGICAPTAAANNTQTVDITFRAISVVLDGKQIVPCDASGKTVEPFIMNSSGSTYLPLRAVAQALGLNVVWINDTNTVELTSGGEVKIGTGSAGTTTGKKTADITYRDIKVYLDGTKLNLVNANGDSVEPFIMNGTTYLPLRVIGEALGLEIKWDGSTNTVSLFTKNLPSSKYKDLAKDAIFLLYSLLKNPASLQINEI